MNHWHMENLAELRRQEIETELRQIHLAERMPVGNPYRAGMFSRLMFNLANWMIDTGRHLRRRYESPAGPHTHQPTGSFAR